MMSFVQDNTLQFSTEITPTQQQSLASPTKLGQFPLCRLHQTCECFSYKVTLLLGLHLQFLNTDAVLIYVFQ